jgi:hypothetical protein
MNENVPYIWRKNYRNEAASPEKVLDVSHDKASQYLRQAAAMATKAASSPSSRSSGALSNRMILAPQQIHGSRLRRCPAPVFSGDQN